MAGMGMHRCQLTAWGLPCPMPEEVKRGERRDLDRATMEPGNISPSWPGMMGSLAKNEPLQLEGLSRVEAGRLGSSPTQPSCWAGVEQTGCQETWVLPAAS